MGTYARIVALPTGVKMEVIEVPGPDSEPNTSGAGQQNQNEVSTKPPLLFIHGSFHAAWCYRLFQHFFAAQGFQTYAVSLRGSAGTPLDIGSVPTADDHIADLSALLPELKLSKSPIIVAHSMGGFVAQKWVELNSSLDVFRLILLASTPPSGNNKLVSRMLWERGVLKSWRFTMGFLKRTVTTNVDLCREMFFLPKSSPGFRADLEGDEILLGYMDLLGRSGKTLDVNSLKKVVKGTGSMRGKVLVLGGLLDGLIDLDALKETATFWDADLKVFEDAPHDVMLYSRWEDIANYMLEWITVNIEQDQEPVQGRAKIR